MEQSKNNIADHPTSRPANALQKPLRNFFQRRNIRIPRSIPLHVLAHGRRIVLALEKGKEYTQFKGKRLFPDRDLISIPVGRRWRLLCEWQDGKIIPAQLLSHESYNHKRNWEKR